jgi:hypothetical protein
MEVLGGVAASVQVMTNLQTVVFNLIELYRGVRDVNETTLSLHGDLKALQFALFLLTNTVHRVTGSNLILPVPGVSNITHSSDEASFGEILDHATKTLSRLETIFRDIAQKRAVGAQLRQYFLARSYDSTIRELRDRLVMYVNIFDMALTAMSM